MQQLWLTEIVYEPSAAVLHKVRIISMAVFKGCYWVYLFELMKF